MDTSTLHHSAYGPQSQHEELVESPINDILMQKISQYFAQEPSKSPAHATPVETRYPLVSTWAASLPDFRASPSAMELSDFPDFRELDAPAVPSMSPLYSFFSDSSSINDSQGPTTPPLTEAVNGTRPGVGNDELFFDVRKLPRATSTAQINRDCSLRRSSEVIRSSSRKESMSRRSSMIFPPTARRSSITHATLTGPVIYPEFVPASPDSPPSHRSGFPPQLGISTQMPEATAEARSSRTHPDMQLYLPEVPPAERSRVPPQLKISTQMPAATTQARVSRIRPDSEFFLPKESPTHVGRMRDSEKASTPVSQRHSVLFPDQQKNLSREGKPKMVPTSRFSTGTPFEINFQPDSRNRYKANRLSMHVQDLGPRQKELEIERAAARIRRQQEIEHGVTHNQVKTAKATISEFEEWPRPLRLSVCKKPKPGTVQSEIQIKSELEGATEAITQPKEIDLPHLKRESESESIPDVARLSMNSVRSTLSQGPWFTKGYISEQDGMFFKMSRRFVTASKAEWVIESDDGTRILKCFGYTNSLSRCTEFRDVDDSQICQFEKRTGTTRVAVSPDGTSLFSIKNTIYSSPHWAINLGSETGPAEWIATGDKDLESVVVTWGGYQVGRIKLDSKRRKHTYILNVAFEMNYCIMAALATVFDDLRTDEGC